MKSCLYPSSDPYDGFLMGLKGSLSLCLFVYRMFWGCLVFWWFTYWFCRREANKIMIKLLMDFQCFEVVGVHIYRNFNAICALGCLQTSRLISHWYHSWLRLIVYRQDWWLQQKHRTLNPMAGSRWWFQILALAQGLARLSRAARADPEDF